MFDDEGINFTPKTIAKYLGLGAFLAVLWLSLFIVGGSIWSVINVDGISFKNHLFNGWVIATWANLASLLLGTSVGLSVLFSMGKSIRINLMIGGFVFAHIIIVIAIWTSFSEFGVQSLRKAEADKTLIEKMREIDWPDTK